MNQLQIVCQSVREGAKLPKYATPGSACFDLFGAEVVDFTQDTVTIATGLKFDIPDGYVMRIYSRSGHGFKHSVRLVNSVGIIDSDYIGEVMVKLICDKRPTLGSPLPLGELMLAIADRKQVAIAQAEIVPVEYVDFAFGIVDKETDRGDGGFGSTDKAAK